MRKAASVGDYRALAQARLPHFLFEYLDGGSYDEVTLRRATLFAEEVARTIPAAVRIIEADERASQLEQALVARSIIDQALGVLMSQNRCTREAAFGILRRASQNRNVKLRDVAATIIERFTGHPAADPPPFRPPTRPTAPPKPPENH